MINLEQKYQKVKTEYLSSVQEYCEFEQEPVNYILVGKFFELLECLKKEKFNISADELEINAGEDNDMNTSSIDINKEDGSISIGVYNGQVFSNIESGVDDLSTTGYFAKEEYNNPDDGFFIDINSDDELNNMFHLDYKNIRFAVDVLNKALKVKSIKEVLKFTQDTLPGQEEKNKND